jgi:hypothetical protein
MEFADGSTGYVLFLNCVRPCPVALYRTADGGRTWQNLPVDLGDAEPAYLMVADPTTLVVGTQQGGYYLSRDGGRTFVAQSDYPGNLTSRSGPKTNLRCRSSDDDGACQKYEVVRGDDPLPVQPPLPADADEVDSVTEDATGRIWAVTTVRSTDRSTVHTAVSTDGGASWRSLPVLDAGNRPGPVVLTAASDDREPWLVIGHGEPARLSAYRGGSDRWRVIAEDVPVDIGWNSVVSAGGGAVAVFGDRLGHLLDDGTWLSAPPTDVLGVSRLTDGSLLASTRDLQGVWLGTRTGTAFAWSLVTVEPA